MARVVKSKTFQGFFWLTGNVGVKKISLENYAHFTSLSRALGTRRTHLAETLFKDRTEELLDQEFKFNFFFLILDELNFNFFILNFHFKFSSDTSEHPRYSSSKQVVNIFTSEKRNHTPESYEKFPCPRRESNSTYEF